MVLMVGVNASAEKAEKSFHEKLKIPSTCWERTWLLYSYEWGHYSKSTEYAFKNQELTGEEDSGKLSTLYNIIGDTETAKEYEVFSGHFYLKSITYGVT